MNFQKHLVLASEPTREHGLCPLPNAPRALAFLRVCQISFAMTAVDTSVAELRTLAPAMPEKIQAIIHEEWNDLDAEAEQMYV